jgi:RNA polymerase sigma factor (sigma-70 family)
MRTVSGSGRWQDLGEQLSGSELPNESLEALVRRAQGGDRAAFEGLVRRTYDQVYRWALVHVGDEDDADDVTQEVLVRLHTRLKSYRGKSRFTTWLFQVTRNAALELSRRKRRVMRLAQRTSRLEEVERDEPVDKIDEMSSASLAQIVRALFHSLPSRQRQVFDLADLQGYSPSEIGEMLDMNAVTVRANLCKARRAIRASILDKYPEFVEERLS